tara:strand:+ start:307 stop:531 length:225 start_codon:yes stop_codon:yes gene_type:complete
LIKKILYKKNNPKKDINRVIENKLILSSVFNIEERLLVGKNPPEEITDKARLSDVKDLNSKKLKIRKIINVSKI